MHLRIYRVAGTVTGIFRRALPIQLREVVVGANQNLAVQLRWGGSDVEDQVPSNVLRCSGEHGIRCSKDRKFQRNPESSGSFEFLFPARFPEMKIDAYMRGSEVPDGCRALGVDA